MWSNAPQLRSCHYIAGYGMGEGDHRVELIGIWSTICQMLWFLGNNQQMYGLHTINLTQHTGVRNEYSPANTFIPFMLFATRNIHAVEHAAFVICIQVVCITQ